MSFIIYDVETTGIRKQFDQILQFAAIRTDAKLEQIDQFETSSRLLPYVVPAPRALYVNGLSIDEILGGHRKSHYAMVSEIRETIGAWCPSTFLGYNSIRFDEEFLRHAFYQCLMPPFLTNTQQSARADALSLMRACAALHPGVLTIPVGENGKRTFALGPLAMANGFPNVLAHEAMSDVRATLHLCRLVESGAPDLWSRFLRFAQKAAALQFVTDEAAFALFEPSWENASYLVTGIGANTKQPNIQYCLDLTSDLELLRSFAARNLAEWLKQSPEVVRRVKVNAAPMLCPLFDAPPELMAGRTEEEWQALADGVRDDRPFTQRILAACEANERVYEPSIHVEQQLYEQSFWSDADRDTLLLYHSASWEERPMIASRLKDSRLRRLARRLAYVERPDILGSAQREKLSAEMKRRMNGTSHPEVPWLTIPTAIIELDHLFLEGDERARAQLLRYRAHLTSLL